MSTKLYVGNLAFETSQRDLENLFGEAGSVREAVLIADRDSGKSRGFGFITMSSSDEAKDAARKFDGFAFQGRNLTVNEARPAEKAGGGQRAARRW